MGLACLIFLITVSFGINGQANSRRTNRFQQFSGGLDDDVLPADDPNVRGPMSNSLVTGDDDRDFRDDSNGIIFVRAPLFPPFLLQGLDDDQRSRILQRPSSSLSPFFTENIFRPGGVQQTPVTNFIPSSRPATRRRHPNTRVPVIDIFTTRQPAVVRQEFVPTPSTFYTGGPRGIDSIQSSFNYEPDNGFGVNFDFFKNGGAHDERPRPIKPTIRRPNVQIGIPIRTPRPIRQRESPQLVRQSLTPQPPRNVRLTARRVNDGRLRPVTQPVRRLRPQTHISVVRSRQITRPRQGPRPRPRSRQRPRQGPRSRPRPALKPITDFRQPQTRPTFSKISNNRRNRIAIRRPIINNDFSDINTQPETFPANQFIDNGSNFSEDAYEETTDAPKPPKGVKKSFTLPPRSNLPFHNDELIFGDFLKLSAIKKQKETPTPKPASKPTQHPRARRIKDDRVQQRIAQHNTNFRRSRRGPRRKFPPTVPANEILPTETTVAQSVEKTNPVTVGRSSPLPQPTKAPPARTRPRSKARQSRRRSRKRLIKRRRRLQQGPTSSSTARRIVFPQPGSRSPSPSNSVRKQSFRSTAFQRAEQVVSFEPQQPIENSDSGRNPAKQLPQQKPPRSSVNPTVPIRVKTRESSSERKQVKNSIQTSPLRVGEIPLDTDGDGSPGTAGLEYPVYSKIPKTSFSCLDQKSLGYYSDPEAHCQVFHFCQAGGIKSSFLCPNGTLYNQEKLACEWWHNVDCASSPEHYHVNDRLYQHPLGELDRFYQ